MTLEAGAAPHADARQWVVLKFGGTSVASRARWDTIGTLAAARRGAGRRVLVVVSALAGVTNALQALADSISADSVGADSIGNDPADDVPAQVQALRQRHHAAAAELGVDADAALHMQFDALQALLRDPRAASRSLAWQAELLALGELMSSALGHAYLSSSLPIGWCDARDWLQATPLPHQTEWAARLSASCALAADRDWRARFDALGEVLITQGFIARAADGGTALLGRGGSDTSAAYFGALLRAACVEIWTDVPGMFSANPRRVPEARLLTNIDYDEAQEIATTGAKVLHPRCIAPCREARVPIRICDTAHPDLPGTRIGAAAAGAPGVKAISTRRGLVLVSMESIGMWQQVGFLADVFEQFKRHGLSVDMLGSSETNVTVSLDPSDNLVSSNVLEALCADLAQVCRVRVIAPCSAVTLVGRGMRSMLHRLSDVLAEFGRERVHLISQSSNDLNLTFVVDEDLADEMLPRLHELLIEAGAMAVHEGEVFGPSWRALAATAAQIAAPWWRARAGALLAEAARGTPCYAYDLATVRARAAALSALPALDRCLYALKANPHPALLRALHALGFGMECVSAGELAHAFESIPGLDPARVLFTPSFAPRAEYADALQRGVWVTLDSAWPLRQWPELFRGRALWLRVDPGFGRGHHEKVRTGGRGAKFGLAVADLAEFLELARALDVRIHGLHAHLGSGIGDPAHWGEVLLQLASLAERIGTVSALDLGGGIGVPADPAQAPFDLAALGARLSELKSAYPHYALWMEPGRFLAAEAGVLLLSATQVAAKEGVLRIGVDGGMNALLRPALYNAWHEIVNLTRIDEAPAQLADVVGPICESGDVLGRLRRLPATAEGDVLLVANAGAYGAVMASTYNLRPLPREVVLDDELQDAVPFRRADIRLFRFTRCGFDAATGVAELGYAFDDGPELVERVRFPGAPFALDAARAAAAQRALRLLHLIAGVSYYKAAVPPRIEIEGEPLDAATAALLTTIYEQGLGEFAYRNGLSLHGHIAFAAAAPPAPAAPPLGLSPRALTAIGGGKDSLVSIEALRDAGVVQSVAWIGNSPLIAACAARTGLATLNVARELDPTLFGYNRQGAYNGHIPVTAINSAVLVLAALLADHGHVVFSNERSASYGSLIPGTGEVNHQWSKGWEFERAFGAHVQRAVAADLHYVSLLRPLSELAVARRFARLSGYDQHFSSCNRNFHILGSRPANRWCGQCPKCHFVFLALAPFMPKPRLLAIFGRNLLDDPAQAGGFDALIEYREHKPFECVGEAQESRAALALLAARPEWREDRLVQRFATEIQPQLDPATLDLAALLGASGEHRIPSPLLVRLGEDFRPRR